MEQLHPLLIIAIFVRVFQVMQSEQGRQWPAQRFLDYFVASSGRATPACPAAHWKA